MSTGWQEGTTWGGTWRLVRELIAEGSHHVEAWGNARDGWVPYLVNGNAGVPVGPRFSLRTGGRLRDLRAAAARMYSIEPESVKVDRC